ISPSSQHTLRFVTNFLLQNNWRSETFTGYHPVTHAVKLLEKFIQDYLLELQKTKIKQQRQKQTEKMPVIENLFKQQQQQQPLLDFSKPPKEEIKKDASVIKIARQIQQASNRKKQEQQQNERIWRSWIGQSQTGKKN
ncbi:MAG: hypothetical protein EBR87_09555, partial [Cytophagia bacterium]|nr:hypothetical protein [Cytophagia bacterium]